MCFSNEFLMAFRFTAELRKNVFKRNWLPHAYLKLQNLNTIFSTKMLPQVIDRKNL